LANQPRTDIAQVGNLAPRDEVTVGSAARRRVGAIHIEQIVLGIGLGVLGLQEDVGPVHHVLGQRVTRFIGKRNYRGLQQRPHLLVIIHRHCQLRDIRGLLRPLPKQSEDSGTDDQAAENVVFTQAANTGVVPSSGRQNLRQRRDRSHRYVIVDGLPVRQDGDLAQRETSRHGRQFRGIRPKCQGNARIVITAARAGDGQDGGPRIRFRIGQ